MKTDMLHNDAPEHGHNGKHLICWKSLFAGLLITFLAFAGLLGLGFALGGIGLSDGARAQNAAIFSGVWFIISAVVSLFLGGYFSVRMSKFTNDVVAVGNGFVIAALFVLILLNQGASAIGWVTSAAGDVASGTAAAVGGGIGAASQSNMVRDLVEDSVADLNLKEAQTAIPGLANRLMRGDVEGAKAYLARQSGKTPAEVDAKIAELKAQADQAAIKAREATATAMKATGWSLFVMTALGAIAAGIGGLFASIMNNKKPLAIESHDYRPVYTNTGARV